MWHFKTLRFWQLKSHKKKHNSVCHPCIECDYLATNTTALLYHNKSNHQNSVYNCDRCNFTAKVSETLRDHKISKHNNIYQSCDEYGNLTKNTFALCYHKKSNHQNTVYNCDQCDFIAKRLWHTETQNIRYLSSGSVWSMWSFCKKCSCPLLPQKVQAPKYDLPMQPMWSHSKPLWKSASPHWTNWEIEEKETKVFWKRLISKVLL